VTACCGTRLQPKTHGGRNWAHTAIVSGNKTNQTIRFIILRFIVVPQSKQAGSVPWATPSACRSQHTRGSVPVCKDRCTRHAH
jgi:hypothetical protein